MKQKYRDIIEPFKTSVIIYSLLATGIWYIISSPSRGQVPIRILVTAIGGVVMLIWYEKKVKKDE